MKALLDGTQLETQLQPGRTGGYRGGPTQIKHAEQKRELTGRGPDNTCVWRKLSQN